MNLDYLKKKKHIFKNSVKPPVNIYTPKMVHYSGIFTSRRISYELVYLRLFLQLFTRKYFKSRVKYRAFHIYLYIKAAFLLTMKSRNSRMGAGVGRFVSLAVMLKPGRAFFLTRHVPPLVLSSWTSFFNKRWCLFLFWHPKVYQMSNYVN